MKKSLIIFLILSSLICFKSYSKTKLDFLFIYYMPYDNNLSKYGESIIEQIQSGTNKKIGAVIQADFADTLGLKRYSIYNKKIKSFNLNTETTDKQVYKDYFLWINENFEVENYCIVFLNHGGDLIEFGLDRYPNTSYSDIMDIKETVEYFNSIQKNKAKLLFLQQCARGSIESIYEFKNCADYTLFSQTELGAPNSYYKETEQGLNSNILMSGKDLAELIVKNDGSRMYNSYTLINNSKIDSFVSELKNYFNSFNDSIYIDYDKLLTINYNGESYWDLKSLVSIINCKDSLSAKYKTIVLKNLNNNEIIIHYKNPKIEFIQEYCGISFFSPHNENISSSKYKRLKLFKTIDYNQLRESTNKKIVKENIIIEDLIFR